MPADLCVALPFHTSKNGYLKECLESIRSNRDVSIEVIGVNDKADDEARALAEKHCDQVIDGPGLCNWRPGAIHWPVFQAWLTTKSPFVTYLFSDDLSLPPRYARQVAVMKNLPQYPACYTGTEIVNGDGRTLKVLVPPPRLAFGGIPTYTESLVIRREAFEAVGGLDFPIHAAAKAEAWIWAACGAAGQLAYIPHILGLRFREHPETISASGKERYKAAVEKTRFFEEDHWRLWKRIEPRFEELVRKAKENDSVS